MIFSGRNSIKINIKKHSDYGIMLALSIFSKEHSPNHYVINLKIKYIITFLLGMLKNMCYFINHTLIKVIKWIKNNRAEIHREEKRKLKLADLHIIHYLFYLFYLIYSYTF